MPIVTQYEVILQLVERDVQRPVLFTNRPKPMRVMVGMWNRPGALLYTLAAEDAQMYNARVNIQLEAGQSLSTRVCYILSNIKTLI